MSTTHCKPHSRRDCSACKTGIYAPRSTSRTQDDPLTDPLSPLHQAVHGGAYYGSVDTSPSTSCESSSSSSSYDSGSSSSSYDSGSSSYDSGC